MVELQEIEEKLKNSFRAVKKDIMELKANSIQIDNFNVMLDSVNSIKNEIKDLKETQNKQIKEIIALKEELYTFKSKMEDLPSKNILKKIDNDISSLKDNFKNKIEKDADILKKINNDIKDVKEYLQFQRYPKPDKTSVKKDEDKQKGFLMKKFEEVVDILAEDED